MEKLFETKNMIVWFDKDQQLQKNSWIGNNENITESEIMETIGKLADLTIKNRPKYCLVDDSHRQFVFSVDLQNWVATRLAKASIIVGLEKFAIIMPTGFIAELSTEQTVDEAGILPFELKSFNNEATALKWLFE